MKMQQPGTDRGTKGETGEREPKGAKSSDSGGERREKLVAGVALGKADRMPGRDGSHLGKHEGMVGEVNEGRHEGVCYHHTRSNYRTEDKMEGTRPAMKKHG